MNKQSIEQQGIEEDVEPQEIEDAVESQIESGGVDVVLDIQDSFLGQKTEVGNG